MHGHYMACVEADFSLFAARDGYCKTPSAALLPECGPFYCP